MGARGGVGGLFGGRGAQGGSPFDDLFFPLAVLAPLPGVAFAGRFPVVLRAHILKRTPFFKYAALGSTPRGDRVVGSPRLHHLTDFFSTCRTGAGEPCRWIS